MKILVLTYVVCPIYFPIWWFNHIHLFCGTQLGKSHFGSLRGSIRDNWSKVEGLSISMYLLFDIPPKKSLLLEVSTMSNTKFDPSPCRCTSFVPWLLALLSSGGHGARGAWVAQKPSDAVQQMVSPERLPISDLVQSPFLLKAAPLFVGSIERMGTTFGPFGSP